MTRMLGLAASLVLLIAAPAAAQNATTDAYGGAAGVLGEVASGGSAPSATDAPAGDSPDADGAANVSEPGGEGSPAGGVAGVTASGSEPGGEGSPAGGFTRVAAGGEASDSAPSTTQPIATSGSLPFTGLDVGLLAAGSVLLIALGFGLRRFGRRSATLA